MTSRHLVHPELLRLVDAVPTLSLSDERLVFLRANRAVADQTPSKLVSTEVRSAVVDDGASHSVRVMIFRPRGATGALPAIIHIHGGGYVLGAPEDAYRENIEIALQCHCLVISVDYRLAPENPHPCALDDCYCVLRWVHECAHELGVDRNRVAVKGESAGGGLAACLALKARDEGKYRLAGLFMIAPMLDDRDEAAANPYSGHYVWTAESNRFGWRAYLGSKALAADVSPYAAASRATDLSGLPSTFVAVGALDLFLEQDMDFVKRLNRSGVPTELHVYPGAYHSFHRAGDTSVFRRLKEDYSSAIATVFGNAIEVGGA